MSNWKQLNNEVGKKKASSSSISSGFFPRSGMEFSKISQGFLLEKENYRPWNKPRMSQELQRDREATGLWPDNIHCWRQPGPRRAVRAPTLIGVWIVQPHVPPPIPVSEQYIWDDIVKPFIREFIVYVKGNQDTPGIPWSLEIHSLSKKTEDMAKRTFSEAPGLMQGLSFKQQLRRVKRDVSQA